MAAQARARRRRHPASAGKPRPLGRIEPYSQTLGERGPRICCGARASAVRPTRCARMPRCVTPRSIAIVSGNRCSGTLPSPTLAVASARRAQALVRRTACNEQLRAAASPLDTALQLWWLNRMLATPAPLQEKMTLFFHGHFTIACHAALPAHHVQPERTLPQLRARQSSRADARRFKRSRDAHLSRRREQRRRASERELRPRADGALYARHRQLHRRRRSRVGARLHRLARRPARRSRLLQSASARRRPQDVPWADRQLHRRRHRRHHLRSAAARAILCDEPAQLFRLQRSRAAAGRSRRGADAPAQLTSSTPVLRTLLCSNVFYSRRAYRALVKSPVEFVVGTYKTLGLSAVNESALAALQQMGQQLFFPPNVAGWPGGQNWLTSSTMIARQNFLTRLLGSQMMAASSWLHGLPLAPANARRRCSSTGCCKATSRRHRSSNSKAISTEPEARRWRRSRVENYDQRVSGAVYLTMATPAYQLN